VARHVHGDDGMGDLDHPALGLPVPTAGADPRHAVELLRDLLLAAAKADDPVTLVTLGPMTNAALLLRTYPEAAKGLRRLVFMGGAASVGNATAAAEFNVWHDPEAAAVVLDAVREHEVETLMYGLDVFYDVRVSRADAEELSSSGSVVGRLAGALVDYQLARFGEDTATVGDAGAVLAVLDPDGLRTKRLAVHAELAGLRTRGQTVVDRRAWSGDLENDPHGLPPTVIDVALDVDGDRWARAWLDAIHADSLVVK